MSLVLVLARVKPRPSKDRFTQKHTLTNRLFQLSLSSSGSFNFQAKRNSRIVLKSILRNHYERFPFLVSHRNYNILYHNSFILLFKIFDMAILKITQKHHNRFNNPFLSAPKTLHIIQGSLLVNSKTVPSHEIYGIGNDFQLSWSSNNGGYLSISHFSQPSRPIWSSIPGQAFVSAALADTEVEESRGSYLVKDTNVHLVCNHQTIDDIRVINGCDHHLESEVVHSPSEYLGMNQKSDVKDTTTHLPSLLITGRLFNTMKKKNRRFQKQEVMHENMQFKAKGPSAYARYWVLFSQKTKSQVGYQVKIEKPNFISRKQVSPSPTPSRIYRGFRKMVINRKRRIGWCWSLSRPRGYVSVPSSAEEEMGKLKMPESTEFNRIWLTHASEKDERFYGFGEQFSHMNLKGKRVPIFVQEQGIGRGDQPITFAANLVSYR